MNQKLRVAINGFGRIGRHFLRQSLASPSIEVVAINDLGDLENLAYLFAHDTVYGTTPHEVKVAKEKGILTIDGRDISYLQIKDPAQLPWANLKIDIVVEATGLFESFEKAAVHLTAGARRLVITAPAKDEDGVAGKTVLMGINQGDLSTCSISSNGSCTTNAAAPVIAILSENPGIVKAVLSTVHAYTATQSIVDSPVKGTDFRRGRAGAANIAPSTTGAAIAVTRVIPELAGKFDGLAFRVPVASGSIADITFVSKRPVTAAEINKILEDASASPRWNKILKVTHDQVVSSDIVGQPYGAIVDAGFTKVIDGDLVKVLSWYDNEFGYVATLVQHVEEAAAQLLKSS